MKAKFQLLFVRFQLKNFVIKNGLVNSVHFLIYKYKSNLVYINFLNT